ncbi:unnamed protein product [Durusdinium trenchii]|uniref:Ubiquitin-like protease family profile domain-containing protein n=1 Tax=Durusdinium trenchii TaxID=1381693 RepID=A0ABP0L8T8_9DINO
MELSRGERNICFFVTDKELTKRIVEEHCDRADLSECSVVVTRQFLLKEHAGLLHDAIERLGKHCARVRFSRVPFGTWHISGQLSLSDANTLLRSLDPNKVVIEFESCDFFHPRAFDGSEKEALVLLLSEVNARVEMKHCRIMPSSSLWIEVQDNVTCESAGLVDPHGKEVKGSTPNLDTLGPGKWVCDGVVGAYAALVRSAIAATGFASSTKVLDPWLCTCLEKDNELGDDAAFARKVARLERKPETDIRLAEVVLFPLNVGGTFDKERGKRIGAHWVLVVATSKPTRRLLVFDSLSGPQNSSTRYMGQIKPLQRLLRQVWPQDASEEGDDKPVFCPTPQQPNAHDCGIHMLVNLRAKALEEEISPPRTDRGGVLWRERIAREIRAKVLDGYDHLNYEAPTSFDDRDYWEDDDGVTIDDERAGSGTDEAPHGDQRVVDGSKAAATPSKELLEATEEGTAPRNAMATPEQSSSQDLFSDAEAFFAEQKLPSNHKTSLGTFYSALVWAAANPDVLRGRLANEEALAVLTRFQERFCEPRKIGAGARSTTAERIVRLLAFVQHGIVPFERAALGWEYVFRAWDLFNCTRLDPWKADTCATYRKQFSQDVRRFLTHLGLGDNHATMLRAGLEASRKTAARTRLDLAKAERRTEQLEHDAALRQPLQGAPMPLKPPAVAELDPGTATEPGAVDATGVEGKKRRGTNETLDMTEDEYKDMVRFVHGSGNLFWWTYLTLMGSIGCRPNDLELCTFEDVATIVYAQNQHAHLAVSLPYLKGRWTENHSAAVFPNLSDPCLSALIAVSTSLVTLCAEVAARVTPSTSFFGALYRSETFAANAGELSLHEKNQASLECPSSSTLGREFKALLRQLCRSGNSMHWGVNGSRIEYLSLYSIRKFVQTTVRRREPGLDRDFSFRAGWLQHKTDNSHGPKSEHGPGTERSVNDATDPLFRVSSLADSYIKYSCNGDRRTGLIAADRAPALGQMHDYMVDWVLSECDQDVDHVVNGYFDLDRLCDRIWPSGTHSQARLHAAYFLVGYHCGLFNERVVDRIDDRLAVEVFEDLEILSRVDLPRLEVPPFGDTFAMAACATYRCSPSGTFAREFRPALQTVQEADAAFEARVHRARNQAVPVAFKTVVKAKSAEQDVRGKPQKAGRESVLSSSSSSSSSDSSVDWDKGSTTPRARCRTARKRPEPADGDKENQWPGAECDSQHSSSTPPLKRPRAANGSTEGEQAGFAERFLCSTPIFNEFRDKYRIRPGLSTREGLKFLIKVWQEPVFEGAECLQTLKDEGLGDISIQAGSRSKHRVSALRRMLNDRARQMDNIYKISGGKEVPIADMVEKTAAYLDENNLTIAKLRTNIDL